jgi:DNA-directed RNA polymerase specialized sigma24 family protein
MRRLSSIDAFFLATEDERTVANVSALTILERKRANGRRLTRHAVKSLFAQRLHLLPSLRWQLAEVPFGVAHPSWIDRPVDLDYHVREFALPAPGDDAALAEHVAGLAAEPMHRSRPLSEVDAVAAARPALSHLDDVATIRSLPGVSQIAGLFGRLSSGSRPDSAAMVAPRTAFNDRITPERGLALITLPVPEVLQLKEAHEATVNDIVVSLCAGALRTRVAGKAELPDERLRRNHAHPEGDRDVPAPPRTAAVTPPTRRRCRICRRHYDPTNEIHFMQQGETGHRGPERPGPDEVNVARVRLLIADALGQLSAEHRAVISRSYYLGWTTAQIADDLHIAEWFVKSRLHIALRALRRALERQPARCALKATDRQRMRALPAAACDADRQDAERHSPGASDIREG